MGGAADSGESPLARRCRRINLMMINANKIFNALALLAVSAQRTEIPLDLGWRFEVADPQPCSFPIVLPGFRYGGGDHNNAWLIPDAHDIPSCSAAACAAGVAAFGLNGSDACFIGDQGTWDITPNHPELGTAYIRNVSGWPPASFSQAAISFDD